jgi:hypothetical protein
MDTCRRKGLIGRFGIAGQVKADKGPAREMTTFTTDEFDRADFVTGQTTIGLKDVRYLINRGGGIDIGHMQNAGVGRVEWFGGHVAVHNQAGTEFAYLFVHGILTVLFVD